MTEIHSRQLHVTPPQALAYWLRTACIRATGEGGVTLGVDGEDLRDDQLDCPDGADAEGSPDVGGEH